MSDETPKPESKGNMNPVLLALSPTLVLLLTAGLAYANGPRSLAGGIMALDYLVYCPIVSFIGGYQLAKNHSSGPTALGLRGFGLGLGFIIVNYVIGYAGCATAYFLHIGG